MSTLKFKTNIKCDGCVATVKQEMDKAGVNNWEVDLENPERILTVNVAPEEENIIKDAVEKAGYKIETVN